MASDAGEPELSSDALGRLEQRLDRASEAAERLIAEAATRVVGKPPPAGWQQPGAETGRDDGRRGDGRPGDGRPGDGRPGDGRPGDGRPGDGRRGDGDLLLQVIGSLRERIPPELAQRIGDALRELLLALRALIDWYLERSERRRATPAEVQDIPIL